MCYGGGWVNTLPGGPLVKLGRSLFVLVFRHPLTTTTTTRTYTRTQTRPHFLSNHECNPAPHDTHTHTRSHPQARGRTLEVAVGTGLNLQYYDWAQPAPAAATEATGGGGEEEAAATAAASSGVTSLDTGEAMVVWGWSGVRVWWSGGEGMVVWGCLLRCSPFAGPKPAPRPDRLSALALLGLALVRSIRAVLLPPHLSALNLCDLITQFST